MERFSTKPPGAGRDRFAPRTSAVKDAKTLGGFCCRALAILHGQDPLLHRKKTLPVRKPFSLTRLLNRVKESERGKIMKCQSEYGTETDALLTQADECTEEWWEDEAKKDKEASMKASEEEEEDSALIVKREARKRGLVDVNDDAGL